MSPVIGDDIADIDADSITELRLFGEAGILVAQGQLHLDREADRVHHAGELHQCAIAHELDDAAVILGGSGN